METVLKLVMTLASHLSVARTSAALFSPQRIAAICLAFMTLVIGIAAIGCAIGALWVEVLPATGLAGAWLIVTLALIVLGVAFAAIAYRLTRRAPPPPLTTGLEDLLRAPNLMPFIHDHKTELLLGAAIIGLLLGSRSQTPPGPRA